MARVNRLFVISLSAILLSAFSCAQSKVSENATIETMEMELPIQNEDIGIATLGAGCFWCIEAIYAELEGVSSVISGYTGGELKNPTYKDITTGKTGHAEVAQITYDPSVITFPEILEVFWSTHDPTTLNRQGADVGTQYRSAVFYHNESQKELASAYKKALNDENAFGKPVVTEITELGVFYEAENYHQDYYANNPNQGYCTFVIAPKLEKFRKVFADKLRTDGTLAN